MLRGVSQRIHRLVLSAAEVDSRRKAEKQRYFLRNTYYALYLAVMVLLLFIAAPTQAQTAPGLTLAVEAGFDGWYKSTYWLPIHVSAANSGTAIDGELQIVINDGPGNQTLYTTPLDLPTMSDKRVTMLVKPPRNLTRVEVNLVSNGRSLANATIRTGGLRDTHNLLYGVITPDASGFDFLSNVTGRRGEATVAYLSPHHLPDTPPAWNSLDVLIIHNSDSSQFSPAQRQALAGWIQSGGQLVVVGGPGWQPTSSGLTEWLPVTPHVVANVTDLPALSQRAGLPFNQSGPYLIAESSLRQGELLWHQEGLPLLARRGWGQGSVYFLALDPTLAPLRGWDGQPILWQSVAGQVPDLTPWSRGVINGRSAITAVSTLAQRTLPTAGTLMLFMFIYIVLIGPVNYKILKRRGQREMAWVTIPVLVLVFSGIAYATGFGLRGTAPILNQMSIVVGQVGSEQARAQTIIGLYSPSRTGYDLDLPSTAVAHPLARTTAFGENVRSGSGHIISNGRLTVSNIRTDIGSVEALIADSYQPLPAILATADLRSDSGSLVADIELVNNGRFPLDRVAVIGGRQMEFVGNLPPGANRSFQLNLGTATATSPTLMPGPGGWPSTQSPLLYFAEPLLGGWATRNEPEIAARHELFRAIESYSPNAQPATAVPPILLVAWSDEALLDMSLNHNRTEQMATTLYLLDVPVGSLTGSDRLSLPADLLQANVLDSNRTYNLDYRDLYLNGGWIEFEFTPWPTFRELQVDELTIVIQQQMSGAAPPAVSLWDWAAGEWVLETAVNWGNSPIPTPDRYLNDQNSVRLRLDDQTGNTGIGLIYPRLTGKVAE